MYYEVYADSLFFLYFGLDLYVLWVVNKLVLEKVKGIRLLTGAALGAVMALLPFLISIPFLKGGIWYVCSILVMGSYTFRVQSKKQLLGIMKRLLMVMIILSSVLTLFMKVLPGEGRFLGSAGILLLGALCCKWLSENVDKKRTRGYFCKVRLVKGKESLEVNALLDTGNTLVEPISGKPVSVVGEALLMKYYGGEIPQVYRVIPFHSVGKKRGILQGFQLDEMVIETDEGEIVCKEVFIAASSELVTEGKSYEMILNPKLLA